MTVTPLTALPDYLVAGDSYTIDLSYGDYPTSLGYTLKLYLRGTTSLDVTATVVNDAYRLAITPTQSATLSDGTYSYSVALTSATERITVESGNIKIVANPATTTSRLSHIETMVKGIEAVLEGRITDDVESLSIAGRSLTKIPVRELMQYRASYYKELSVLQNNGTNPLSMKPVLIQFVSP